MTRKQQLQRLGDIARDRNRTGDEIATALKYAVSVDTVRRAVREHKKGKK